MCLRHDENSITHHPKMTDSLNYNLVLHARENIFLHELPSDMVSRNLNFCR